VSPVIEVKHLSRTYGEGESIVHALRDVSLTVERGEFVAIMGSSGSGKSTLMNMIGLLDVPSSGTYLLDGVDASNLDDDEQAEIRNAKIGFVFQQFNLIRRTPAVRQVELPLIYAGVRGRKRRARALDALAAVGLADRADHLPSQLSGGQQQRVAIARAIVTEPALVLADEPTGALDTKSTGDVMDILTDLHRSGRTIVVITHEDEVATYASRVVTVRDGLILADRRQLPRGARGDETGAAA
jgi:putative ABC transport system ATP-binding protein